MIKYLAFAIVLYVLSYLLYLRLSHGLGHRAEYLQLRRFIPCALLAVLPLYLAGVPFSWPPFWASLVVGLSWIITYPLCYYLTYRKNSPDFGFHLDTVFGLYVCGWLLSLKILVLFFDFFPPLALAVIALLEFVLLLVPIWQAVYYLLYGTCVDETTFTLMFATYKHEAVEYLGSLPKKFKFIVPLLLLGILAVYFYTASFALVITELPAGHIFLLVAEAVLLTYYLWKRRKGVFVRTGIVKLCLDVRDYLAKTNLYAEKSQERLDGISISASSAPLSKPSTIIMVIGESASRDYMSAFGGRFGDSTPWLRACSATKNYLLFPHAYSCDVQTVPVLKYALTEANWYNGKDILDACSVIEMARLAGYKTYWYSNQSYLGAASTLVTVLARTADTSAWVKHEFTHYQDDSSLLDYLEHINPAKDNFVVIHLKGSHFNFINRYPQSFAKFSEPHKYDLIPNYLDSLAYTDHILQRITEYARKYLNLKAMIYFSDHATRPAKQRSPIFDDFAVTRIPLFIYLSDEYIAKRPGIYAALKANRDKYWTNDLVYDLVCGILDLHSNHFDERNSLTSPSYRYKREDLRTGRGKKWVRDDKSENVSDS